MFNNLGDGMGSGLGMGLGAAGLAWLMFQESGEVGHYNLYRKLSEEEEINSYKNFD